LFLKATQKELLNPIAFSYNTNGRLEIELPQGAKSDSYKLYLFINIVDDLGGTLVFNIKNPVIVESNDDLKLSLATEILGSNQYTDISTSSDFVQQLNSGDVKSVSKNVINMATAFNLDGVDSDVKIYIYFF
jgi:hypothetical protein